MIEGILILMILLKSLSIYRVKLLWNDTIRYLIGKKKKKNELPLHYLPNKRFPQIPTNRTRGG